MLPLGLGFIEGHFSIVTFPDFGVLDGLHALAVGCNDGTPAFEGSLQAFDIDYGAAHVTGPPRLGPRTAFVAAKIITDFDEQQPTGFELLFGHACIGQHTKQLHLNACTHHVISLDGGVLILLITLLGAALGVEDDIFRI